MNTYIHTYSIYYRYTAQLYICLNLHHPNHKQLHMHGTEQDNHQQKDQLLHCHCHSTVPVQLQYRYHLDQINHQQHQCTGDLYLKVVKYYPNVIIQLVYLTHLCSNLINNQLAAIYLHYRMEKVVDHMSQKNRL